MYHYSLVNRADTIIEPFPNPNYPSCPYS